MSEQIDSPILEHLKRLPSEMAEIRRDTAEIKSRLGSIESGVARIGRDEAGNYAEIIENRHMFDRLAERIERIERRLELA